MTHAADIFVNIPVDENSHNEALIQPGDCGIVLRADGSHRVFTVEIDQEAMRKHPVQMSDQERTQLHNIHAMMLFAYLLSQTTMLEEMIVAMNSDMEEVPDDGPVH